MPSFHPLDLLSCCVRVCAAAAAPYPRRLTLDRIRSDLSHETSAKLARLAGLLQEWRRGRLEPGDADAAAQILRELQRLHLGHARTACASFPLFGRLVGVLATLSAARCDLAALSARGLAADGALARFETCVTTLRAGSRALVESLSSRHAARFADLVDDAVAEIRRETGGRDDPHAVPIVVEGATAGAATWVPRADAATWSDLLRNFLRNAVQAVEDRCAGTPPQSAVSVHLRAPAMRPGVVLEIVDEGGGMTPDQVASMWRAGSTTHGAQRGHGLTQDKRAFLERRAGLEVRSAPGVGTCVRVELPHAEVAIRAPRFWLLPPVVAPLLAVVAAAALGSSALFPPRIVTVEVRGQRTVRALDARGQLCWQRRMDDEVVPNYRGSIATPARGPGSFYEYLVLRGRWPWQDSVILATQPTQGPGRIWRLDARGHTAWVRRLAWTPPRTTHTGNLVSVFAIPLPWNSGGREAIVLNVRDGAYSSTTLQFFTPAGDSLGAYQHPGHLEYLATTDINGDGRAELLLNGKNNDAPRDSTFLPARPTGDYYADCLVALEPPLVDGQAWPYARWRDVPPASERAYLLIPPLTAEQLESGYHSPARSSTIVRLDAGRPDGRGGPQVELVISDGRIYHLGPQLRPLSCSVGDKTMAAALAPTRAFAPLVYVTQGRRESIDLPIQREP